MAFSLAACAGVNVIINDPGCTAKTFPTEPVRGGEGRVSIADQLTRLALPGCPEVMSYLGAMSAQPDFKLALDNLPQLPKRLILDLMRAALDLAAEGIAAACKAAPANGWELFSLFAPALLKAEDKQVFGAITGFLTAVGESLASSRKEAYTVLSEYALPFLMPLLRMPPDTYKVKELLATVYAMVPPTPEAHIDAIRALQNAVNHQETFIGMLPSLLAMETTFDANLIALYVYFCVLALDLASMQLRAAAINMLVTVAGQNAMPILALVPKLHSLSDDGWWEVHAQLGRLCGVLLAAPAVLTSEDNEAAAIVELLAIVLAKRQPAAQMVALSAASPRLAAYPQLLPPFVESLLELSTAERAAVLAPGGEVELEKAGGEVIAFPTLPVQWPDVLVAETLMATARSRALDTLEVPFTDVLSALLPAARAEERAAWSTWLRENKDYLYVALCDEELCGPITLALKPLFVTLKDDALGSFSTLLSSLRMVCDNAPQHCAKVATTFLLELVELGEPFTTALRNLVQNFDAPMRDCFATLVQTVEAAA